MAEREKKQRQHWVVWVAVVTIGLITLGLDTAEADVVVFQEGADNTFVTNYSGTDDTRIDSGAQFNPYGGLATVAVGSKNITSLSVIRSLFRFDLTSMGGQGLSVNSATLTLYRDSGAPTQNLTIQLYGVTSTDGDWIEGNSTDGPTWNQKNRDSSTTPPTWTAWAGGTAGGGDPGDGTYANLLDTYTWTGTADDPAVLDLSASLVEDWIGGTNYGLYLRVSDTGESASSGNNDLLFFGASEHGTAAMRPKLTIDYVPEPATMVLLGLGGVGLLIRRRRHA